MEQLDALEAAAPHALATPAERKQLAERVGQEGKCRGAEPETYFPPYIDDPARTARLTEERADAYALCHDCPVLGLCLVRDYSEADHQVGNIHGVAAGLGARDRRALLPLWVTLTSRLALVAKAATGEELVGSPTETIDAAEDAAPARTGAGETGALVSVKAS